VLTNIIGDFFQVKGGKRLPKGSTFSETKTEHPYLRVTDFERNGLKTNNIKYISSDVQATIKNYIIDSGDVYISIAGTIGVAGIISEKFHRANLTENAAKFIPKEPGDVHNRYFSYILNSESIQNIIKSKTMAVGVPKLALFRILEIPLNLPPLEEQKKITEILDAANNLRQKDQQLVEHYNRLSQSLFLDMFGDPIRNPIGWDELALINVSNKITDGTHKTPIYIENGVLFLSAKNIKKHKIVLGNVKYISLEEHETLSKRCNVEKGDILITKSGSIGMSAMVDIDMEFSVFESLALIKYDRDKVNGRFLLGFMNTPSTQFQYSRHAKGVGVKHLHLKDLRNIKLIFPPLVLQNEFSDRVMEIEKQKELAQQALQKSNDLFNSLLQKAFKGELTDN
jgi:type I restriction enzyme S subunit